MLGRIALVIILLGGAELHAFASERSPGEVRVRLRKQIPQVDISGFSLEITPASGVRNIQGPPPGLVRARIERRPSEWRIEYEGGLPSESYSGDRLWIKGEMLRLGVEPVPYALELAASQSHKVDVIAHLDLESYLMGVLPAEMPASWPIEALKAQVVAARSFVLKSAHERRGRAFDVESTVFDQVFTFLHEAERHPEWRERIRRAVRETRGEVLVDDRRQIVKAFYSADCGCTTEDPRFVWGRVDAIQSVKDPSCHWRQPAAWTASLDRAELRERLITAFRLPSNTKLRTLTLAGKTPSGRVAQVGAIIDVGGTAQSLHLSAQEFRRLVGFQKVLSTDFRLSWSADRLEIRGVGVGHGVGMCQSGARAMATRGSKYREILRLYYPKTQLWTLKRT